jgi:urease accessory protein UreE
MTNALRITICRTQARRGESIIRRARTITLATPPFVKRGDLVTFEGAEWEVITARKTRVQMIPPAVAKELFGLG